MLSNEPTKASPSSGAKVHPAASVPPLDPSSPIEVASTGDGTITDPAAKDVKPPVTGDPDFGQLI
jgi:hypothetical protein